ncbi:MAG: STAS domain-containing protein [Ruminococcus sp.]|nr:STAS domain-containing protein [Ruminococcus sp.]
MINTDYQDGVMTVYLSGEIDQHTSKSIRQEIDSRTEALRPNLLCLDFSKVRFMDSSGIGLIMGRFRQMSLIGGRLKITNLPENIDRIVKLSGVQTLGVLK